MKIKSPHVHFNEYDSYTFASLYDTSTDLNFKV